MPATAMTTDAGLYRLMTWLSPAFPVGAYSYSHGIETAVEAGLVRDADTLARWVETVVTFGSGRMDATVFRLTYAAVAAGDTAAFEDAAERGALYRGTAELALESNAQGEAFLGTVAAAWPLSGLAVWQGRLDTASYPVAVAMVAALAEIDEAAALGAYLTAFAGNLVNAGVRLIPLGQTDGQKALAKLEAPVTAQVETTCATDTETLTADFGAAIPMVDWTSAAHETQYTRLFRS